MIEQSLKKEECYFENIQVISNFIKFDENGNMIKFCDNMIHSLNKNVMENLEIYNNNFDIVLTEENNFYDIEKYL